MTTIHDEATAIRRRLEEAKAETVKIALFGQPGAGKSSLINKIIGSRVAETGVETDKTVDACYYEKNGLKFCDLPGYGTKNFPESTYFDRFDIPSFDLFLCVTSGKLHKADTDFFQELRRKNKVCIFVVNKHDDLWEEGVSTQELEQRKIADIYKHVGAKVAVQFTSCRKSYGLDELNKEIQHNLGEAKRERWMRGAKAYSQEFLLRKKAACERYVALAAGASAANGLNPIPGANIAVDISILMKLFKEIRDAYGLDDTRLSTLAQSALPVVGRLANQVTQFATEQGILMLLKSVAGRQAAKQLMSYIPFIGQAIAAGLGYAITSNAGTSYLEDCHELAKEVLDNKLAV
ncbi:MAG: GTPase [Sphaerotilus sulfidivorans]|uniref:GTPase n=1 Tax=Sphaerotilus sulfidivorans TaxID=639200 RepID=UPI003F2D1301